MERRHFQKGLACGIGNGRGRPSPPMGNPLKQAASPNGKKLQEDPVHVFNLPFLLSEFMFVYSHFLITSMPASSALSIPTILPGTFQAFNSKLELLRSSAS